MIFFDQICQNREFAVENGKVALMPAFMVVTYYIKLFHTGPNRHNGILMSLLESYLLSLKFPSAKLLR